jgi:hypothetical protein
VRGATGHLADHGDTGAADEPAAERLEARVVATAEDARVLRSRDHHPFAFDRDLDRIALTDGERATDAGRDDDPVEVVDLPANTVRRHDRPPGAAPTSLTVLTPACDTS